MHSLPFALDVYFQIAYTTQAMINRPPTTDPTIMPASWPGVRPVALGFDATILGEESTRAGGKPCMHVCVRVYAYVCM
jgi:hypothetical protein